MANSRSEKFVVLMERIKGGAMIFVGLFVIWLAYDNYMKLSAAETAMATVHIPDILVWVYDNIGLIPGVILQSILGLTASVLGIRAMLTGK